MASHQTMSYNVLTTKVNEDLIVSSDSSGSTRRVRFTPEQEEALKRLESSADYKFKSWSDATRQMWATLFEHIMNEPFPPNKENAPTGDVKIRLEIEES